MVQPINKLTTINTLKLDEQKLKSIISELEVENIEDKALFGIYEDGGIQYDTHIQANKEGLICYAIQLLKAAENHDSRLKKEGLERTYSMSNDIDWIDTQSDIFINSVEPFNFNNEDSLKRSKVDLFKEKVNTVGCLLILILIVVSIFVGIGTLFEWMI